jgi:hypothetical protein
MPTTIQYELDSTVRPQDIIELLLMACPDETLTSVKMWITLAAERNPHLNDGHVMAQEALVQAIEANLAAGSSFVMWEDPVKLSPS